MNTLSLNNHGSRVFREEAVLPLAMEVQDA
jgi:hypothetical protein